MVHRVPRANVVVDFAEDTVVPVQGGQGTTQVAPLLQPAVAVAVVHSYMQQ